MGGSQPSLSSNDALPKAFSPSPQARKLHRLFPQNQCKIHAFPLGSTFPDHLLQQFQYPVPSSNTVQPAGEEELAPTPD